MATAEEYAGWIVQNQDKIGTPEFNTVAQAYQLAKSKPAERGPDPTGSFFENMAAGAGKAVVDTGRGIRQLASYAGIGDKNAIQREIDESRHRDAALMNTGGGLVGNVGTQIGTALLPGAAMARAGGAVGAAGKAMLSAPATLNGALVQGGLGAAQAGLQPVASDESRGANMLISGMAGAALPVLGMAAKGVKAAVEPLYEGGRNQIIGRALRSAAGSGADDASRAMAGATELVPGSAPTAAQVANNGGIAALERTARSLDPTAYAARDLDQNAARVAALRGIAGDAASRDAAVTSRDSAAKALYGKAFASDSMRRDLAQSEAVNKAGLDFAQSGGMGSLPTAAKSAAEAIQPSAGLQELSKREGFQQAEQAAKRLAADKGEPLSNPLTSLRGLHYIKLALDDMLEPSATNALGRNAKSAVADMRTKLLKEIESISPAYGSAREVYKDMSGPVNQMDVGQYLLDKLTPALSDFGQNTTQKAATYAQALRDAPRTLKGATGFSGFDSLDKVLTPQQLATTTNVGQDLARKGTAEQLGRGVGSDTVQKLAMTNILEQAGLPKAIGNFPGVRWASRIAYDGPDEAMKQKLAGVLLNPKQTAQIMQNATPSERQKLLALMLRSGGSPALIGGSVGALNAQQQ